MYGGSHLQPSTNSDFKFLSSLYAKTGPFPPDQAELFFCVLNIPTFPDGARNALNASTSEAKVLQAIEPLKPSKAAGPDGFLGLYYKTFSALLVPHLANYFNTLKQGSMPSPDALRAHISMIPKTPEDTSEPQAFRPISLLNNELKILGKILSTPINKYMCHLVHRDQVGFVPGRQADVRKVVHLIHLKQPENPWFSSLFGYLLTPCSGNTCNTPHLQPQSNMLGIPFASFSIYRDTRQGCPLSPSLFLLAL